MVGNVGEFYILCVLIDFIVMMFDLKLGEIFGDFISGIGGFFIFVFNYMGKSVCLVEDGEKL